MHSLRGSIVGIAFTGAAAGLLLGLIIGLYVMPVSYVDTDIANLPSQQKEDWVTMVSAAYALDHNLEDARQRIYRLDRDPAVVNRYVAEVAQRAIDRNNTGAARNISELAIALGGGTSAIRSYLESMPTLTPASR